MIIDYKLITTTDFPGEPALKDEVKEAIEKGWQPLGAPFVIPETEGKFTLIGQAMVKYAEANVRVVADIWE